MNKWYIAAAYGEGAYNNSCAYNDASTTCATGGAGTSQGGSQGQLSDTGLALIIVATVACALIATAIVVRVIRRKKPTAQPAE